MQQGHINSTQRHVQHQLPQQQQQIQYQIQPQRQQLSQGNQRHIYQQQAPRLYQQPTFRQPLALPRVTQQPQVRYQQPRIRQPFNRPNYGRSVSRGLMRTANNILSNGTDYAAPEVDFSMFGGESMGSELCFGGDMEMGADLMGGDFDFGCFFE